MQHKAQKTINRLHRIEPRRGIVWAQHLLHYRCNLLLSFLVPMFRLHSSACELLTISTACIACVLGHSQLVGWSPHYIFSTQLIHFIAISGRMWKTAFLWSWFLSADNHDSTKVQVRVPLCLDDEQWVQIVMAMRQWGIQSYLRYSHSITISILFFSLFSPLVHLARIQTHVLRHILLDFLIHFFCRCHCGICAFFIFLL